MNCPICNPAVIMPIVDVKRAESRVNTVYKCHKCGFRVVKSKKLRVIECPHCGKDVDV